MDEPKFSESIEKYAKELLESGDSRKKLAYLAGIWYTLLLETLEDDYDPVDWWKNE